MRRMIPGLESSDSAIESEIATRLDRVEEELEKAVAADSDLLSATARYLLQAGGKRFRPMLVLLAGYFGDPADPREDGYLHVIRRKTGSLIPTSCRLGGTLSDAAPEHVETLEAFGESLGLAFQLSDDLMDITSTQLELGKEPGTDMKEGVYTL